jgi:UDP-2,3-diacylglucosamine hydrolase
MNTTFAPKPGPVIFISDAHLGARTGPEQRAAWLVRFLESLPDGIGGLLIVGDLFDFWFEYRHAIPKAHFSVCRALAEITRSGVPVLYFGGNHDFWAGSYLRDELGLLVADGPQSLEIQGRRIFVAHGDGMGSGDIGYRLLKAILRNRVCIALYRWIHPDLGVPIAHRISSISRRHTLPREVLLPKLVRDIARPHLAEGHDAVVIGHVHEPVHLRLPNGEFLILGDWIENFTYATLEQGRFALLRFHADGETELLSAEDLAE